MCEACAAGVQGFALGASLIVAIGAQNVFVLRQALLKRHVLPVVLFCAFADAALGAVGLGAAVRARRPPCASSPSAARHFCSGMG